MDPNEALAEIRRISARMRVAQHEYESAGLGEDLRLKVEELDEWLSKGGFLPVAWERKA